MTFREKTAWISFLSMAAIYSVYFWPILLSGRHGGAFHEGRLLVTVVALAGVQAVLTIAVAILKPREAKAPPDERDRLIELRATKLAYVTLAASIACACFFGAFDPPLIFGTNALLFILVIAEILRSGCQIIQYRRGT
jgi:hypothetical protein